MYVHLCMCARVCVCASNECVCDECVCERAYVSECVFALIYESNLCVVYVLKKKGNLANPGHVKY